MDSKYKFGIFVRCSLYSQDINVQDGKFLPCLYSVLFSSFHKVTDNHAVRIFNSCFRFLGNMNWYLNLWK